MARASNVAFDMENEPQDPQKLNFFFFIFTKIQKIATLIVIIINKQFLKNVSDQFQKSEKNHHSQKLLPQIFRPLHIGEII